MYIIFVWQIKWITMVKSISRRYYFDTNTISILSILFKIKKAMEPIEPKAPENDFKEIRRKLRQALFENLSLISKETGALEEPDNLEESDSGGN